MQELGLYIHWPFCVKKCYYCDLNSHIRTDAEHYDYVESICKELKYWYSMHSSWTIKTIFFGGGTPSLMKPEWIDKILKTVASLWQIDCEEITMEMNPSVSKENLSSFKAAGINRISFGVQSFDDSILKYLGRDHSADEAVEIIKFAQNVFDNISIDLMYYLPNQTIQILSDTISKLSELNLQHVSWYSLTIEENTVFGRLHREGNLHLPSDDTFCEQYELIYDKMETAGLRQYELSNFAKPGYESQHNLIYWEYKPFLGIGPGAHSRLHLVEGIYSVENYKLPEQWLESVKNHGHGVVEKAKLTDVILKQEKLMMKLRLNKGLKFAEAAEIMNLDKKLINLNCNGDILIEDDRFNLTSQGFMRYNSVINYLHKGP